MDQRAFSRTLHRGMIYVPHPVDSPFLTSTRSQVREGGRERDGGGRGNDGQQADWEVFLRT